MAGITNGYNPSVTNGGDNIQELSAFQYNALAGSNPLQTATPPEGGTYNTFQYENCSPCPIKVVVSRVAKGANGKPDPLAAPVLDCKVLKVGQSYSWSFKDAVITSADIAEADSATILPDAITFDDDVAVLTVASLDLDGAGAFLNC